MTKYWPGKYYLPKESGMWTTRTVACADGIHAFEPRYHVDGERKTYVLDVCVACGKVVHGI